MSNVIPIYARRIDAEARRKILQEGATAFGRLGCLEDTIDQIRYGCERLVMFVPTRYYDECLHVLRWIRYEMPTDPASLGCVLICLHVLDARYVNARGLG
jgi:hypothetical protein